ncbi:MAG: hypothetical protein H6858_08155 [Rhodospirillales bacterium]|nr:hypothetical protein [Alphaproteobacteria bacterium]MCB9977552.1 hypothetical protein [Rhodospirillales bacterium]
MSEKGKNKKLKIALVLAATICVGAGLVGMVKTMGFGNGSASYLKLNSFKPGTTLNYEVFSNGEIVEKGNKQVDQTGSLKLDASPYTKPGSTGPLTYNLNIDPSTKTDASDRMNLLMKLDRDTGNIEYSGSGVSEFSKILISNGTSSLESKADWAGAFAGDNDNLFNGLDDDKKDLLKLAFQGYNLQNDGNPNEGAVVEVFFGSGSVDNASDVQARYTKALAMMTEQLSAVMMQQAEIIGAFFDAKMQLETQRKLQELMARAHKDYHPSEQICRFGTFVKSLAHTERAFELDMRALNVALLNSTLSVQDDSSAEGPKEEVLNRITQFRTKFCNPRDNNDSLDVLCAGLTAATPVQRERFNKDVDYFRTIDSKLTLDANFADATLTNEEEEIFALAQNLYLPNTFDELETNDVTENPLSHYNSRKHAAVMAAAQNSFVNIVGMKTSAPPGQASVAPGAWPPNIVPPPPNALAEDAGWTYMKAFIRELGGPVVIPDAEIHQYLGERPSYYAQMEVLTKKIFESPNFYTNLYDKPANVDRIGAAIDAIGLMNMRDRFDSSLRREMLTALLVEDALQSHVERVTIRIFKDVQKDQPRVK